LITYEVPHRLTKSLLDIQSILGNRKIAICRELTKLHEEVFRGTVEEAKKYFKEVRGELVIVIAGAKERDKIVDEDVEVELEKMKESQVSARDAINLISRRTGISKRDLYKAWLGLK
jgi:16S rRNA (cytidine1402-2'-O)-methyltransferase